MSDPCPGEEKKIFKEIMHFHYDLCDNALSQGPSDPGVMKLTIKVDPPSFIITLYSVCPSSSTEEDLILKI